MDEPTRPTFASELEALINAYSQENHSSTPDFVLAEYLLACLAAWNRGVAERERWYGRTAAGAATTGGPVPDVLDV